MAGQVPTYGYRPATSFLSSLEPSILSSNGAIKVNSHLQVGNPSFANIFAAGDAIDWDEEKQSTSRSPLSFTPPYRVQPGETEQRTNDTFHAVMKTSGHAKVVSANILNYLQGKPPTQVYKGSIEGINMTTGKVCFRFICSNRCSLVQQAN